MGDDDEMGWLFVNPIILMPESDYVKLVIHARFLNSVTDLTNYSWPLEPVQMIMTLVNGIFFSVSDLSSACHQVPLSPKTQKLTSFIIGWKQYTRPEDPMDYAGYLIFLIGQWQFIPNRWLKRSKQ